MVGATVVDAATAWSTVSVPSGSATSKRTFHAPGAGNDTVASYSPAVSAFANVTGAASAPSGAIATAVGVTFGTGSPSFWYTTRTRYWTAPACSSADTTLSAASAPCAAAAGASPIATANKRNGVVRRARRRTSSR